MIDTKLIMELREKTGAGIVDAKKALEEAGGDIAAATDALRKKGIIKAAGKSDRATGEGQVHSYIHANGKVGALVEVLCETDFVARTPQFQEFVHDIAMQVAASRPLYVGQGDVPEDILAKEKALYADEIGTGKPVDIREKIVAGKLDKFLSEVCLLKQAFIKDEDITIEDHLKNTIAKLGENIQIRRFARFSLGE